MHDIYLENNDAGLEVINILNAHDQGEPPTATTAALWVEAYGLTNDVVYDEDKSVLNLGWDNGVVPRTFVIDRDGVIVLRHGGIDTDPIEEAVVGAL